MKMAATVIRADGACDIFVNGILNEEIRRINLEHENEVKMMLNKLADAEKQHDDFLAYRVAFIRQNMAESVSRLDIFREKLETAWCKLYGLGEVLGMWVYEHDDN